jgi:hypothetical protein
MRQRRGCRCSIVCTRAPSIVQRHPRANSQSPRSNFGRRPGVDSDLRPTLYSGHTLEKDDSLAVFGLCAPPL